MLSLCSVHKGVNDYKLSVAESKNFQDIESSTIKLIQNYDQYSELGVRVFFVQTLAGIFFTNPDLMSELSGKINSLFALEIFNNNKEQTIVIRHSPFRMSFSGILFYIATFAVLLFGFDATRNKEYLKFLSSINTPVKAFSALLSTRILLIILSFLFIMGCSLVLALIEGIDLYSIDFSTFSGYMWCTILLLVVFFLCGTAAGSIRSTLRGFITLFATWIFLVIVIPGIIDSALDENNRTAISSYKLHLDKIQIANDFENNAIKTMGKYKDNTPEGRRAVVEGYWNNEFKQMQALEENHKIEIEKINDAYNFVSLFTPTTFYSLTAAEVSSRGFGNYKAFYLYLQELRQKFVRFYIDRVYYNDPNVVVNFVKGDENLFQGKSRLPDNFGIGVVVNLGYIIIMLAVSFFLFKRAMFRLDKKEIESLGDSDIEVKTNKVKVLKIKPDKGKAINKMFFTLLSREIDRLAAKGFKVVVKIGEVNIAAEKINKRFVYYPRPEAFPGEIKVKDLCRYIAKSTGLTRQETIALLEKPEIKSLACKKFKQFEDNEGFDAVLALTYFTRADIFLFNDLPTLYHKKCAVKLKDRMDALIKESVVIFLTTTELAIYPDFDVYAEGDEWLDNVEALRIKLSMDEKRRNKEQQEKSSGKGKK
jgi:ABC-type transport system involved in multi-copper enzyme maturation permease subunit